MKIRILLTMALIALSIVAVSAQKTKKTTKPKTTTTPKTPTVQQPTQTEYASGLRETLTNGVSNAIKSLGREDGFFKNVRVKIPVPSSLRTVEKGLRVAGQGGKVDSFVLAMNRAAEKAVPEAIDIFADSIKQMTLDDARQIVTGGNDSITQFFRRTSEEKLRVKFLPTVQKFTNETGVTAEYKAMIGKAGFLSQIAGKDATDIDGYVTQKALDGLFLLIADEEKNIRENPVARTTSILQKIFGIGKK
jgi:Protein of unknown function (DUF4197)